MITVNCEILRRLGLIAAGYSLILAGCRRTQPLARPPASAPATQPVTQPTMAPVVIGDYPTYLKTRFPSLTTQPTRTRLPPAEAAHLRLDQPVFCDNLGELWITDPAAPPWHQTLATASQQSIHLVADPVRFVHRAADADGRWQPQPLIQTADGKTAWLADGRRVEVPDADTLNWADAISWNGVILVPARRAAVCLTLGDCVAVHRHDLQGADDSAATVRLLPDTRGVLAWRACDGGADTAGVPARWIDGAWHNLDGWPDSLVHLLPLLDGGVLAIGRDEKQNIRVTQNYLDVAAADESRINALIDQLSDLSADARAAASVELARWGASAWPILEKAQSDVPPEAQVRITRLLENRASPALLGYRPLPGPLRVVARRGASLMLALPNGVAFQRDGDGDPITVAPAVLTVDGHGVRLAPRDLAAAALDDTTRITVCGNDWFAVRRDGLPRWWLSNHFTEPLLRKEEGAFDQVVGLDADGRFLLRQQAAGGPTLLIDPAYPDAAPRLPVWVRVVEKGRTGWTDDGWPVMQSGGAWALHESAWTPIDLGKVRYEMPPAATTASTPPAPLLTDSLGRRYVVAAGSVRVVTPAGHATTWPVDDVEDVQLFESSDRLFWYSISGKLRRYSLRTDSITPQWEATFSKRLPTVRPRRVWLDPAGRLDMVYDDNALAICFLSGRVPPGFAELLTAEDLRQMNDAATPDP